MPTQLVPNLDAPILVQPDLAPLGGVIHWGGAPSWNREKKEFDITPGGQIVMLNDIGAFIQWIWKALITARFRYKIYTYYGEAQFGNDFPTFIGKRYNDSIMESVAVRFCREAIEIDTRVKNIPLCVATLQEDAMYITISLVMVTGRELQFQQYWTVK